VIVGVLVVGVLVVGVLIVGVLVVDVLIVSVKGRVRSQVDLIVSMLVRIVFM
jgi:hypothetical protein